MEIRQTCFYNSRTLKALRPVCYNQINVQCTAFSVDVSNNILKVIDWTEIIHGELIWLRIKI